MPGTLIAGTHGRQRAIYANRAIGIIAAARINATFEPQIFDLPQRKRITDVHHHRETDNPGRTVEITERILHRRRLWN